MKSIIITLLPVLAALFGCSAQEKGAPQTIEVGKQAPDFTLFNQRGESVTLSALRGKNVVLYFYPKDDTPGCTKEACSFRDDLGVFDSLNTVILGVSVDDTASHRKFAEKYNLNFDLLSDTDKSVCKTYGTLSMMGFSKRMTFVIDSNGILRKIYPKVDVTQHATEIAEFVRSLH